MSSGHRTGTATRAQTSGAIRVLQDAEEYLAARSRLDALGWDVRRQRRAHLVYALRLRRPLRVDVRKSWDVAWFAEVLDGTVGHDEIVIDVGGVHSELPWALHLAGFRHVHSCDIDPRVLRMPFGRHITYHVGQLESIDVGSETVGAITAVSTLEHGVDVDRFFRTASGLLRPGGLLCISTDYWPTKLDVSDTTVFGLPWKIHDRAEAQELIARALDAGLATLGDDQEIPEAGAACIQFAGRGYTFLGAVLRKPTADDQSTSQLRS
jgi:SAM-dependent methyltransferase